MRLTPVKRLVLETMWFLDEPDKAVNIAEEVGLNFPSVMMHILGLTKMGYVKTPEKGYYVITEKGKDALGLPEIGEEKARKILGYLPVEKSFRFYADVGKPLDILAASLPDFRDKILKVNVDSVGFHIKRGDFQAWFRELGDVELARRTLLLKERGMSEEKLRMRFHEIVKDRCEKLLKIRQGAAKP
jgi:DNA-binding transcriptional ArsR family regulator